jgi:hypothetical protein
MRVEVYDEDGNRYMITFNGRVTREKALRLFDLIELLGGVPEPSPLRSTSKLSKFNKVHLIIKKYFPLIWFSSKDIQNTYEQEFKENIRLSTISTYLSRMVHREILIKNGARNNRKYKIFSKIIKLSGVSS